MIKADYHMHTDWCDGSASAEEMIRSAVSKGMEEIGFSGHGYTAFDRTYSMSPEAEESYRQELEALREKWKDKIRVYIGIERDFFSDAPRGPWEYVIGSVHYIRPEGAAEKGFKVMPDLEAGYVPIDESPEILRAAADALFDGDMISLAEEFFATAGRAAEKTGCDIIGHFDLISKFNENGELFDDTDPRYIAAWKAAADCLAKAGALFEINTGAMSRGYRSQPYPSDPMREYIRSIGGRFILSSDSHRADTIGHAFDLYEQEADVKRLPGLSRPDCQGI